MRLAAALLVLWGAFFIFLRQPSLGRIEGPVMFTDTAFIRNLNYHTPNDRPETLDYGKLAQVVDGVAAVVVHLADGS